MPREETGHAAFRGMKSSITGVLLSFVDHFPIGLDILYKTFSLLLLYEISSGMIEMNSNYARTRESKAKINLPFMK